MMQYLKDTGEIDIGLISVSWIICNINNGERLVPLPWGINRNLSGIC